MGGLIYFLTSVFAGLVSNAITIYLQKTHNIDLGVWVFCIYFALMVFIGIFAFRHYRKISLEIKSKEDLTALSKIQHLHTILFNYASHPEILHVIDANGKEYLGGHAGNFCWKELTKNICKEMRLTHLRYSNLGSVYHLQDIANAREIEIPTDNRLEAKLEDSGIRNGQILLIVENVRPLGHL